MLLFTWTNTKSHGGNTLPVISNENSAHPLLQQVFSCAIIHAELFKVHRNKITRQQEKFKAVSYHITVPPVFATLGTPPLSLSPQTPSTLLPAHHSGQTGLIRCKWYFRKRNMTWSSVLVLEDPSAGLLTKCLGQSTLMIKPCPCCHVAQELSLFCTESCLSSHVYLIYIHHSQHFYCTFK